MPDGMFKVTVELDAHNGSRQINKLMVRYQDESISIDIKDSVLQMTSKSKGIDINNPSQFYLVNSFIKHKGDDFARELFRRYKDAYDYIKELPVSDDLDKDQLPYEEVFKIFDMFQIEDVLDYIKNYSRVTVPSKLPDEFDPNMETDKKGSQDQTYTRSQYLELAALVVIIKATLPIVSQYVREITMGSDGKSDMIKNKRIKTAFRFYWNYEPYRDSEPFQKALDFTKKIVHNHTVTEADIQKILIKENLSFTELDEFRLAQLLLVCAPTLIITDDNDETHIVTLLYAFIINKSKPIASGADKIIEKTPIQSGDQDGGSDSQVESYKVYGDIRYGNQERLKVYFGNIEHILASSKPTQRDLMSKPIELMIGGKNKKVTYKDIYKSAILFKTGNNGMGYTIHSQSILLLTTIFKGHADPRYISYLDIDNVINMLTLGFMYMWNLGHEDLAMLLLCTYGVNDGYLRLTTNSSKDRIGKENIEKLEELFPLRRTPLTAKDEGDLIIKKWVEDVCREYFNYTVVSLLPSDMLLAITGTESAYLDIGTDLKISLTNYMVKNEAVIKEYYEDRR